mmetsp:Transcript_35772/g.100535  ORF Transcript_35772/g.100535 Transcript_35772/m.100535 type:complete len:195 (+) Transcript_35772:93-677(+)
MDDQDNALLGFTADAPAPAAAEPMSFLGEGSPAGTGMGMAAPMDTGFGVDMGSPAAAAVDHFSGMPVAQDTMGKSVPEVTKLREWEDQHEKELDAISRKEETDRKERRLKASDELSKWYDERTSDISKKKNTNRADEGMAQKAREAAEKPGANPWERVVDLIDTSARTADESRDTSRMRALLIQLKSNPVVAAA